MLSPAVMRAPAKAGKTGRHGIRNGQNPDEGVSCDHLSRIYSRSHHMISEGQSERARCIAYEMSLARPENPQCWWRGKSGGGLKGVRAGSD